MTRHQSAFLDLTTPGGLVMARWQNRWQGEPVTFEGAAWRFVPFEWSGLSSGGAASGAASGGFIRSGDLQRGQRSQPDLAGPGADALWTGLRP